eukprot:GEMP01007507.1.p1 GENE.GEMP01007507.1~~GEMP01007507.1.p1  ORF type:complete len:778 (+),score=156.77 GEMP01007507.1:148-2481(+)
MHASYFPLDVPSRIPEFDPLALGSWEQLPGDLSLKEACAVRWKCEQIHGCLLCEGVPANLELALLHLLNSSREVMRQMLPVATRYLSATLRHFPDRWKGWGLDTPKPPAQVAALLLGACSGEDCTYGDPAPDQEVIHVLMVTLMSACALTGDQEARKVALKFAVRAWDACQEYDATNMPKCLVAEEAMEGWGDFILAVLRGEDAQKPSKAAKWALRLMERWLMLHMLDQPVVLPSFSRTFTLILQECVRLDTLRVLRLATQLEIGLGDIPCSSLTDLAMKHLGISDMEQVDWIEDFAAVCRAEPSEAFKCVQEWSKRDPNNAAVVLCWAKVEGADVSLHLPADQELVVALEVCRASCPLPHQLDPRKMQGVKNLTKHESKYVRHRAWLLLAKLNDRCDFTKDMHAPVNYAATVAGAAPLDVALEIGEMCCDFDLVAEPIAKLCSHEDLFRVLGTLCDSFVVNTSATTLGAIAHILAANFESLKSQADVLRNKIARVQEIVFASQRAFLAMPSEAILFTACVNVPKAFPFLFHYYMGGHRPDWSFTPGCFRTELAIDSYIAALCGSMRQAVSEQHILKIAQMVLMVSRKLLGLSPWVPLDPRSDPIVDETKEEVPHWGGCLILEHFGTIFAREKQRIPANIKALLIQTLESTEFRWPAFRALIACGILCEKSWQAALRDLSSSLRRPVFLYAISLVLDEYSHTLTSGSPWTRIVVETCQALDRRKRGRDDRNEYDDWPPAQCFAYPWDRVDEKILGDAIRKLVAHYVQQQKQIVMGSQ